MFKARSHELWAILWVGVTYLMCLFIYGYFFGRGDQIEIFPEVLQLSDGALFQKDFNAVWRSQHADFSIRTGVVYIVSLGERSLYYWVLFLHVLSSLVLFLGTIRLGQAFGLNKSTSYWLPLIGIVLFYDLMPGGNSLFSTSFTGSTLAFALGVWALVCALRARGFSSGLFLMLSALFQPLVGIHLLLLIGVIFIVTWRSVPTKAILSFSAFAVVLLVFILFLNSQYSGSNFEAFYHVFFSFRNGHHYLPSFFSSTKLILAFSLLLLGLIFSYKSDTRLFWMLVLIALGAIVYLLLLSVDDMELVAKTQWFKTMVWVPILSGIAILKRIRPLPLGLWAMISAGLFAATLTAGKVRFPSSPEIDSYERVYSDSYVEFSLAAKEKLGKEDLCIVPFSDTRFQIFSKSSVYVSFKSIIHSPAFMQEWAHRIQQVYGVDPRVEKHGFSSRNQAEEFYYKNHRILSDELVKNGVTHMVATKPVPRLKNNVVLEKNGFYLYRLSR
jgi:hypothetical protein